MSVCCWLCVCVCVYCVMFRRVVSGGSQFNSQYPFDVCNNLQQSLNVALQSRVRLSIWLEST
jgi:hypothetical protein